MIRELAYRTVAVWNAAILFVPFALGVIIVGCQGEEGMRPVAHGLSQGLVNDVDWETLATRRIYFGHQSVGYNIIRGIEDVAKERGAGKLKIVETSLPGHLNGSMFAHSRVGKNLDPVSKIRDFSLAVEEGFGQNGDIAFFKFCYVDINAKTDVDKLFSNYKTAMSELRRKYPRVTFVHFTVPVTTVVESWKTRIKKLVGIGTLWEYADAIQRARYNELIRGEYGGKEPIFDIAAIESTDPAGRKFGFRVSSKWYEAMVPCFTDDGGHLNEFGRRWVASHLLSFIKEIGR